MITLYQFQFSHFCEKARWALDYKGVPYIRKNLLPGPHRKTARRWAPKTSVPILVDDDTVIQDSAAIITFLDQRFPDRPLTPQNPDDAKEAVKWEEHLDEEIGVPLRLWFYYHALPDRDRAVRFLLDGAPWYGKPLFAFIFPQVRAAMRKGMNIHAESARQSEERLLAALEKLDAALKDRQFLVADSFSRADLTACALLSPYCAPGRSDAEMTAAFPAALCALRDRHKNRRFFAWVLDTYSNHRQPGAPGTSETAQAESQTSASRKSSGTAGVNAQRGIPSAVVPAPRRARRPMVRNVPWAPGRCILSVLFEWIPPGVCCSGAGAPSV